MGGGSGQTTAGAHTMPNFIKTAAVAVAAALACAVAGAADFSAQTIRLAHTAAVSHAQQASSATSPRLPNRSRSARSTARS